MELSQFRVLMVLCIAGCGTAWANELKPAGQAISLADPALYTIIIPENASRQEMYSAKLLSQYLTQFFFIGIHVQNEPYTAEAPVISIGETLLARQNSLNGILPKYAYQLVVKDGNLFIRGGSPGPLNGVIAWLEEDLGCRWYAPPVTTPKGTEDAVTVIPKLDVKRFQVVPRFFEPPFEMRETLFMYGGKQDPEWALLNRLAPISYHTFLPEESGAGFNSSLFIHTYTVLLPEKEFFASHPDYFALRDGERKPVTWTSGSVCYTNPEVAKIMAAKIIDAIQSNPKQRVFSVSQADTTNAECECDNCQRLIRQEGVAGAQLRLANEVAAIVSESYPDIIITTLSYGRDKPETILPHKNVVVFYAPIMDRWNQVKMLIPLGEIGNITKQAGGWLQMGASLYWWDYIDAPDIPLPTFDMFDQSLAYLTSLKVRGYFADCCANGVSLDPLKRWCYTKKLWNPAWSMDGLLEEFIDAYYGVAAPQMKAYLDIQRRAWRRFGQDIKMKGEDAGIQLVYTDDELNMMAQLLSEAYEQEPEVTRGRIAREWAIFLSYLLKNNPKVTGVERYESLYNQAVSLLPCLPDPHWIKRENAPSAWSKKIDWAKGKCNAGIYSPNSIVIEEPLTVAGMSEYLPDPQALGSKATRHTGKKDWGVQWHYSTFTDFLIPGKRYVLRMRVRPEVKRTHTGGMFVLHAFQYGNEERNKQEGFPAEFGHADDGTYRWIVLGIIHFTNPAATGMLWMSNNRIDLDEAIWYDCLEFIPLEEFKNTPEVPNIEIAI